MRKVLEYIVILVVGPVGWVLGRLKEKGVI